MTCQTVSRSELVSAGLPSSLLSRLVLSTLPAATAHVHKLPSWDYVPVTPVCYHGDLAQNLAWRIYSIHSS